MPLNQDETQKSNLKAKNHSSKLKTDLRSRAYKFSISIIFFLKKLPNERIYWIIGDQLLRSSTSIGANIIEAKSASSKRDFMKYYEIALKSANETKYWLGLLRDASNLDKASITELLSECKELSNILGASLLTMKNRR